MIRYMKRGEAQTVEEALYFWEMDEDPQDRKASHQHASQWMLFLPVESSVRSLWSAT